MGTLFIKPLFRYQPRKGLFEVEIVDFDGVMGEFTLSRLKSFVVEFTLAIAKECTIPVFTVYL